MKIELWMLVATGLACAAGFGALAVLVLLLDAKVRRLVRLTGALQSALEENLKGLLLAASAPVSMKRAPPVEVAAAATEPHPAAALAPLPAPSAPTTAARATEEPSTGGWTSERRLLVMRLAARGNPPDQIAAALRIPLHEINLFFQLNRLSAAPAQN